MKKLIYILLCTVLLNASILKEQEEKSIKKEQEKAVLEADVVKDSWINPLSIEADFSRHEKKSDSTHTKKLYLNFDQDIFRSGGIFYTIQKGNLQKKKALADYDNNLSVAKIEAYTFALQLKKIDLQLQQQAFLVKNKTLEIEKKQAQYLNSLIDIEELDSAVIEKNDLLNQTEDLAIQKASLLNSFKNVSDLSYEEVKPLFLSVMSLESYLQQNTPLLLNQLQTQIDKKALQIENSSYLPKVSVYSQLGTQKDDGEASYTSYNTSGIKVTIPLDFSMNQKKEIKQINYQLAKLQHNIQEQKQRNQHTYILQAISSVENKIKHSQTTIKSYEQIFELTQGLYKGLLKTKQDLETIKNRLASSKLDVKILALDKQIYTYELYKNIKE